jgi:integrase
MITPKRHESRAGAVTWKVQFRGHKKSGGTGTTSESFDSEKKALQFAGWIDAVGVEGALKLLYDGEQENTAPTMDEVAADHFEHLTGIEDGTRLRYASLWARTWHKHLGDVPANHLTQDHIRKALNELATHYAPKSLMNQRGLLSGVCDRCVEKGYLPKSPTRGLRLPQGKHIEVDDDDDDDHEMVCLTLEEWNRLYEFTAASYKPFVRFLTGTGCRYGEAIVLRVKDFDTAKSIVRIRRALKWSPNGKHTIGPPKTKQGRRSIVLPPEILADLPDLLKDKQANDLVFTAPRGGMIDHRNFWSKVWRPAIWRAQRCDDHFEEGCVCGTGEPGRCRLHAKRYGGTGMPGPCGCLGTLKQTPRIHDLRHTHASWLLSNGVPVHIVSARLGHRKPSVTYDIYTHLLPDAHRLAAEAASLAFSGASSATPPALTGAAVMRALREAIQDGSVRPEEIKVVVGELVA